MGVPSLNDLAVDGTLNTTNQSNTCKQNPTHNKYKMLVYVFFHQYISNNGKGNSLLMAKCRFKQTSILSNTCKQNPTHGLERWVYVQERRVRKQRCKTFIQPRMRPPFTGNDISEPLQYHNYSK